MIDVSLVTCRSYEEKEVERAVAEALDLLGGVGRFVKRGDSVFVKVNNFDAHRPEKAATTHPALLRAMIRILLEAGADPVVGEDPEGGERDFDVSGIRKTCSEMDVPLVNLRTERYVESGAGSGGAGVQYVAERVVAADVLISLPKLKTHGTTTITGAVKNLYGCLPNGTRKANHHRYIRPAAFSNKIVDLLEVMKPRLSIVDGVIGMEGEGPAAGSPRKVGCIVAGSDPVSVDAVSTAVLGLDPLDVDTTRIAHERGLGEGDLSAIRIRGAPLDALRLHDFVFSRNTFPLRFLRKVMPEFAGDLLYNCTVTKPRITGSRCENCGTCAANCPAGAIEATEPHPVIDYDKCTRCLCCQEFCRHTAVLSHQPWMGKAIRALYRILKKMTLRALTV